MAYSSCVVGEIANDTTMTIGAIDNRMDNDRGGHVTVVHRASIQTSHNAAHTFVSGNHGIVERKILHITNFMLIPIVNIAKET